MLLIREKLLDLSILKGFRQCVHQGVKSVTYLSKVTSLDWDHSIEKMQNALSQPKKKSTLYEEAPSLPWGKREWTLYRKFKHNMREKNLPLLRECGIGFQSYEKWLSEMPAVARIQPAFYPLGINNYFISDFLFESLYHKQLADILGMLPSTSVFFSVNDIALSFVT